MKWNPFVKSGVGALEYKLCEFLHVTPRQLGDHRKENPYGIMFLEQRMIYEAKEKEKYYKELERKSHRKR